jgi:tetratricopeptide (TPR) repeat protein
MNFLNLFKKDYDKEFERLLEKSNEYKYDSIKMSKYLMKAEKYDKHNCLHLFIEAREFFTKEDFNKAIKLYDQILKKNNNSIRALIEKGICLEYIKDFKKAIICYNNILKINPNSDSALNNKGIALSSLSKYNEAIDCFNKILEKRPRDKIALRNKKIAEENLHFI